MSGAVCEARDDTGGGGTARFCMITSVSAASSPAFLTVTLLPLAVQGHARAMAPAGNVGGGGGGAAKTAGTG